MKTRFPARHRDTWRDRFLEIARQAEVRTAPRSLVIAAGLRARVRAAAPLEARIRAA